MISDGSSQPRHSREPKILVSEFTAMKNSGLMPAKEPPVPVEAGDRWRWPTSSLPENAGKVVNSHIRAELVEHGPGRSELFW